MSKQVPNRRCGWSQLGYCRVIDVSTTAVVFFGMTWVHQRELIGPLVSVNIGYRLLVLFFCFFDPWLHFVAFKQFNANNTTLKDLFFGEFYSIFKHICLSVCVFVTVCMCMCLFADLNDLCQALNCDDDCEVIQGYDTTLQRTVFKAYCVCNVGYTRVRVLDGFRCDSQ